MSVPNPSTAMARVVIDELLALGVDLVALSPGSRSAALAIAAAGNPDMETVVFLDERSAAFFALGRAKTTGRPAAVLATSGTAPANWFPAVVEADASCTPLVLLSADRPARLRGVGSNQTIDQVELFGNKVRFFADVPAPDDEDRVSDWRGVVRAAVAAATGEGESSTDVGESATGVGESATGVGESAKDVGRPFRPGPAHLNLSFEEPTVPVSNDGRSQAEPFNHPLDRQKPETLGLERHIWRYSRAEYEVSPRGLVIAGDGAYDREGLLAAAVVLGWPVLATALSGMRGMGTLDAYGHRLLVPLEEDEVPDIVVAVGSTGPNERLEALIGSARTGIRVDRWGRNIDPGLHGTTQVATDPVVLLESLAGDARPDPTWHQRWAESDRKVRSALDGYLRYNPTPTTAYVAWAANIPARDVLVVASSLPIREVDAHLVETGPVVANRGASGIDGFVSTALGASSVTRKTLALAGDLSLFHDANAWLNDGDFDVTVVVVNNGGGALFDRLPQREHAPDFERLFIAPLGRRVADLAALHGLNHEVVTDMESLGGAMVGALTRGGRNVIEVPVDRGDELATQLALAEVARSALGG